MATGFLDFKFSFLGEPQIARRLQIHAEAVEDLGGAFDLMDADFLETQTGQFKSRGVQGGGLRWVPLSPEYALRKAVRLGVLPKGRGRLSLRGARGSRQSPFAALRRVVGLQTRLADLVLSGRLKKSLTERGGEHIYAATNLRAVFGTAVPWAGWHQSGTKKMPRRRPIEFTARDKRRWVRILQRWLHDEFDVRTVRA